MNKGSYKPVLAKQHSDLSARWYNLETHHDVTIPFPLDIVRTRLEAAFEKKEGRKQISASTSYSGSFTNDHINASFSFQHANSEALYYIQGRLQEDAAATRIEMLIQEDEPDIPPVLQIFLLCIIIGVVCYRIGVPLLFTFFIVIAIFVVKKIFFSIATDSVAEEIQRMATPDNWTTPSIPVEPQPESAQKTSGNLHLPEQPVKRFGIRGEHIALILFLTVWTTLMLVIPRVPDVSDTIYTKCTVTRSEGYEGDTRFWICYKFNNRMYNIRMLTTLGKNHVGSQVFIKLDKRLPDIPHFLQDQPVPDRLLKSAPPPEGWNEVPTGK